MTRRAFDPSRGHFSPKRRKAPESLRPGKTNDDYLPVGERQRVKDYNARCSARTTT